MNHDSRGTTLNEIPVGARVRVLDVDASDEVGVRLLEMGITPGIELLVVGVAPLGDPMELELRGYLLSVRKREAACVSVVALASPS